MDRMLLRPTECADALGCSRAKVYELLSRGELPSIRVGGRLRVPVKMLQQWIDRQSRGRRAGARWWADLKSERPAPLTR